MGGGLYHLPLSFFTCASGTVSSVCLLNVRPARCGEFIRADVPLGRGNSLNRPSAYGVAVHLTAV
jgi:hypothetical protein